MEQIVEYKNDPGNGVLLKHEYCNETILHGFFRLRTLHR
jgi:hypothetical protein